MKYRRLDSNNDYSFGRNAQDFASDREAVKQAIQTRLLLLQGEWWEDTAEGLPLFQSILGVRNISDNKQAADLLIQQRILGTTGVTSIATYTSTIDDSSRTYIISCDVNTVYGIVAVEVTL